MLGFASSGSSGAPGAIDPDAPPASAEDLFVSSSQIGRYHNDHFQLSDNFYRQQLAVPIQLDRNLPGAIPAPGRNNIVNKALRDDGPGPNMAKEWRGEEIARTVSPKERVAVERFFEPDTHGNDADYAVANSYMPAPVVQFYGKQNEEHYPIWGMNSTALRNLSTYPEGAAYKWASDSRSAVQNTSAELENSRNDGGVGKRAQLGLGMRVTNEQAMRAHLNSAEAPAAAVGEPASNAKAERASLGRLPGGRRADELSLSYHDIGGGVHESAYSWKESELVHNSLLDVRNGSGVRSDGLKNPPLPFTPFNLPNHSNALGNV